VTAKITPVEKKKMTIHMYGGLSTCLFHQRS